MSLRFVADADFNHRILKGLERRERGIDLLYAKDAGLIGQRDPIVLRIAASSGRVLISHDRKTMPKHFATFLKSNESPGLIIVSQELEIGLAIEDLMLLWAATNPPELMNQIRFVPL